MVCAANVCRSPLAEYLLGSGMESLPEFEGHSVSSAGVGASPGADICERVGIRIGDAGAPFAETHRSRRLSSELVEGTALILTASRAERSAVASLAPGARSRTFTLREAADLVEGVDHTVAPADLLPFEAFAAVANGRRGLVGPAARTAPPRAGLFGRRSATDPLDVVDGHSLGGRRHEATLTEVSATVDRLLEALRRFAA